MRLFVSISLPEECKREILRLQEEVRAAHFFEGTYVTPDNLHITLHFFGSVDDNLLPLIGAQLPAITIPPCSIRLKSLEVNSHSRPHVLWVSVEAPCLVQLAARIQEAFPAFKEERAFNGHITIARMRKVNKKKLQQALVLILIRPIEWVAFEYALQVSETLPEGPLYTTLGTFELK